MKTFINYLQSMEVGSMPGSLCRCSPLFTRKMESSEAAMLPGHLFSFALAHRGVHFEL